MKFQINKYYQHSNGEVIHIIDSVNTFFHGSTLLGECEDGSLMPVGRSEDNAVNYKEVSGWKRSCYTNNFIPEPFEPKPDSLNCFDPVCNTEEITPLNYINAVEKIWLNAWQRELGPDKTLTSVEQGDLNNIRSRADQESFAQSPIDKRYFGE